MISKECDGSKQLFIEMKLDQDGKCIFVDKDDQCMKTCIVSFEILNNAKGCRNSAAICKLADLHAVELNAYINGDNTSTKITANKEICIVGCAAESILKHLYLSDCMTSTQITFQSRIGYFGHRKVSDISVIDLSEYSKFAKDSIVLHFWRYFFASEDPVDIISKNLKSKDTVSHTYAYLSEGELCIFFNPLSDAQLEKIHKTLEALFLNE